MNWDIVTTSKSEGGLGIINLLTVKHSLMAKNLFNFLNKQDTLLLYILYLKYGYHNFWTMKTPLNCSTFCKCLCMNASTLKPFLWINCLNQVITSFLHHPWMFDILSLLNLYFLIWTSMWMSLQLMNY